MTTNELTYMTYKQVAAAVHEIFPDAEIDYDSGTGWSIITNVYEEVDEQEFADTPAGEAYRTPTSDGGDSLAEWAESHSLYSSSYHHVAEAYNASLEKSRKDQAALRAAVIAEGISGELYDNVLANNTDKYTPEEFKKVAKLWNKHRENLRIIL